MNNAEFLKGLAKLKASPVKDENYVSPLESDVMKIKGTPDVISNKPQKIISGDDFKNKINALRKMSKGIPMLGAITSLGAGLMSGDASAAIPVLSEADDLGPQVGTLEQKLESGEKLTDEEMKQLYGQ